MCQKTDCSLFAVGTHQKKRPDNLIMGRTFAGHLLDMFEFHVTNYQAMSEFSHTDVTRSLKPVLVF